jgi:hypothetical protein
MTKLHLSKGRARVRNEEMVVHYCFDFEAIFDGTVAAHESENHGAGGLLSVEKERSLWIDD